MSTWRGRLCGTFLRREWLRAEADGLVNAATLVLLAASVALLGSLVA